MLNLLTIFDMAGFLSSFIAIIIVLTAKKRPMKPEIRVILILMFSLLLFKNFSNLLEWSGIYFELDAIEDNLDIFQPMFWGYLFYSVIHQKIEKDIRGREKKYKILFESKTDVILIHKISKDGVLSNFIDVNQKACDKLGYSREDLLKMGPMDIDASGARGDRKHIIERLLGTHSARFEILFRTKSKLEIPFEVSSSIYEEDDELFVYSIARDITERRISQGKIQKQVEKLKNLDKLKNDFIRNINHELRSPLVPLSGYLHMLYEGEMGELAKEQRDSIGVCIKNTERLENLIGVMLDLTKLESGKINYEFEPVQIALIIEDVLARYKQLFTEADITPDFHHDEIPRIPGDSKYLTSVFENLISNALKYTQKGSVKVKVFLESEDIHIIVKDTGIGIDKKYHKKVFERMFQIETSTKRSSGGLGFGLAITKKIIEDHHGKIWVESQIGKGAEFHILLPKGRAAT